MIVRLCAVSVLAGLVLIVVPAIVFAALPPAGNATPKSKAQDACKKGSVDSSFSKGTISGGGKDYDNVIYLYENKVVVTCEPTDGTRPGDVVFCGLSEECKIFSKDSQQGKNLVEMFDAARAVGLPSGDAYKVRPEDLANRLFSREQIQQFGSTVIGRSLDDGFTYWYSNVIDTVGRFSSFEESPPDSLSQASDQAFSVISDIAREAVYSPPSAAQPFPAVYPPSWELSPPPEPYLTDAYPIGRELEPLYSFDDETIPPEPGDGFSNPVTPPSTFPFSPADVPSSQPQHSMIFTHDYEFQPRSSGFWRGVGYYFSNPGKIPSDTWSFIRSLF